MRYSGGNFWSQHREGTRNWLAFGLLLAAWNASDNDAVQAVRPRPDSLRGYAHVSVRAVQREKSLAAAATFFAKVTKA
jgi:hypothetical protein